MSVPDGYMTVEQVVQKYGRTKQWWYRQIGDTITGYTIPGLRGTFLREPEVEKFLQPRPKSRDDETDDDGRDGSAAG